MLNKESVNVKLNAWRIRGNIKEMESLISTGERSNKLNSESIRNEYYTKKLNNFLERELSSYEVIIARNAKTFEEYQKGLEQLDPEFASAVNKKEELLKRILKNISDKNIIDKNISDFKDSGLKFDPEFANLVNRKQGFLRRIFKKIF